MNFYDILGIPQPKTESVTSNSSGGKRRLHRFKGGNKRVTPNKASDTDEAQASTTVVEEKSTSQSVKKNDKDITLHHMTLDSSVEEYEPKLTRPTISIYEYARVHTMLADNIESQKSIKNFIDDVEVKGLINPLEIAFYLLLEGKWNATIDRGYEMVSYSKLKKNPQWESMIKHYFNEQHETQQNELFKPLGLV